MATAIIFRGGFMDDCPCLIPDEHDNCVDCGKAIDMPNHPCPDLGDIAGIAKLREITARGMDNLEKGNTDPKNPKLPRLRMVGTVMVRVPHTVVFREILVPSYMAAKRLGYRGTYQRWQELVQECRTPLEL
jgi:hypothetical protein